MLLGETALSSIDLESGVVADLKVLDVVDEGQSGDITRPIKRLWSLLPQNFPADEGAFEGVVSSIVIL